MAQDIIFYLILFGFMISFMLNLYYQYLTNRTYGTNLNILEEFYIIKLGKMYKSDGGSFSSLTSKITYAKKYDSFSKAKKENKDLGGEIIFARTIGYIKIKDSED